MIQPFFSCSCTNTPYHETSICFHSVKSVMLKVRQVEAEQSSRTLFRYSSKSKLLTSSFLFDAIAIVPESRRSRVRRILYILCYTSYLVRFLSRYFALSRKMNDSSSVLDFPDGWAERCCALCNIRRRFFFQDN
ncbi:unnamed protein product [Amoebophrya sp. A120]|nr:unnamed protein product [Amoebophrya sp. A120]|eukprot:GSA120T00004702001.1